MKELEDKWIKEGIRIRRKEGRKIEYKERFEGRKREKERRV